MTVKERFAARRITDEEQSPSAETVWYVMRDDEHPTATDEAAAYAILLAAIPTSYTIPSGKILGLNSVSISDISETWFDFRITYAKFSRALEYEFDIGLNDVTVTHSLATTAYTGSGRTAPNFQGGININADGKVQGINSSTPSFTFSLTKNWAISDVTTAYQLELRDLCGKYNQATFGHLPAGCCRFIGARGRPDPPLYWPIQYRFEVNPNETNIKVGDITVASKLGWQYLDIFRRTIVDNAAKKRIEVPHSVYVHTVPGMGPGDFSKLGLF